MLTGISWCYILACSPCPALIHVPACTDKSCDQLRIQDVPIDHLVEMGIIPNLGH